MPFTRAGWNARNRHTGIMARTWHRNTGGGCYAQLIEFRPSGDLAWYRGGPRGFLEWEVRIDNLDELDAALRRALQEGAIDGAPHWPHSTWDLERRTSAWPRRERAAA